MLLLVGQDVLYPVDHAPTDFEKKRPPANGPPTLQSPFGKIPAISELLLIDVVAGEFWMVHGFAPLRCFRMATLAHLWASRHSCVLHINASSPPVIKSNSAVDGYLVLEGHG